jgi:hypothetical protein
MTDTLNIFLSHKHEGAETARGIKACLTQLTEDGKLNVFLSEEIVAGDEWFAWIQRQLGASNLLLLLFTDKTMSWDWCLYEAGLFQDLDADTDTDRRRVVCLSGVEHIPSPLKHLQAVDLSRKSVKKFLIDLYLGTELTGFASPLSPWLAKVPETLDKAAEDISQLMARKPVEERYFTKSVLIHIADPQSLKSGVIPPDARVEANESTLQALFDRLVVRSWRELEEEAREHHEKRWINELAAAMQRYAEGRPPHPIQATFRARKAEQIYRPVLYRVDSLADGSAIFKVLFLEDVSWRLTDIPYTMGNLITSLSMATRFRYEMLEKYRGKLRAMDATARQRACEAMIRTVNNIEEEGGSRGLLEKEGLIDGFATTADRDAVATMYARWYEIRDTLLQALQERDGETVEDQLDALYAINRRFLDITTKRLATLMAANGTEAVAAPRQARNRRGKAAPDHSTRERGSRVPGTALGAPAGRLRARRDVVGVEISHTVQPGSVAQRGLEVAMSS